MASHSAVPHEHGNGDDDYLTQGNESYATNHRHLQDLYRLEAFQQVTTKVPPSYDERSSWFTYEHAIDDWCDFTELDNETEGQLCATVWKVKQRFSKGFVTEIA